MWLNVSLFFKEYLSWFKFRVFLLFLPNIGTIEVFANGPEDLGSIPGREIQGKE